MITSLRTAAMAVGMGIVSTIVAPTAHAAPEFVNGLALDGAMLDGSGE